MKLSYCFKCGSNGKIRVKLITLFKLDNTSKKRKWIKIGVICSNLEHFYTMEEQTKVKTNYVLTKEND